MRKMKTNIQYLLLSMLMICGMLASCTEETPLNSTSDNSGSGKVILSYSVGKSIQSRADTDAGWTDFNENEVTRLDLYIFRNNGELFRYIPNTKIVYDDADETYNNVTETTADDWEIEGLDPEDITDNDQIYLIANCDAAANIETLSGLQDEVLNGLVCNAKQDKFVMVGAGEDVTITPEENGNDVIISVNLVRVAAKICLSFASTTNWTDVSYRFVHHATTSALLKESEANHSQTLSTSPSEDGLTEITDQTENLYNDEGTEKLVLYSYANDWYKEGEDYTNPDVNGGTDMSDDQIYKQEPIDETKQTYILLRAPYNNNYYYYKVPVNYRLPINNDEVFDTEEEWEAFKESYRHLYQLQRNYIYDITVTIDRKGGSERKPIEVQNLEILVKPWTEKEITVPAFE